MTKLFGQKITVPSGSGSGSGGGRQISVVPGCGGHGGEVILQQTDAPSVDAIGDFGTGSSALAPPYDCLVAPAGYTATRFGTPGSASCIAANVGGLATHTGLSSPNHYAIMWETASGECDHYLCPAGTWDVPQVICGNANATWTDCYIIRVNSAGVPQQTIGHASGQASMTNAVGGGCVAVVTGSAATFAAGDRIVFLLVFTYSPVSGGISSTPFSFVDAMGHCTALPATGGVDNTPLFQGPQFARDGRILTPMHDARAVYPGIVVRQPSGSGSGRTRGLAIVALGCGPYRIGMEVTPPSGGRRGVGVLADCCQTEILVPSGSGPSGGGGGIDTDACVQANCTGGVAAAQFTFTIAGITNGSCIDCALLNGTWTLTYYQDCEWYAPYPGPSNTICGPNVQRAIWDLTVNSGGVVLKDYGADAFYTAPLAGWNCRSPLTLSLHRGNTLCSTYPSSVTITPV